LSLISSLAAEIKTTLDPQDCPYLLAPDSSKYSQATAGSPNYDDAKLWPLASGTKSRHAKQVWPKTRLWVWANPGKSMRAEDKPLNPENWLENGKPATTPCDADTDFEFPDAPKGQRYDVNLGGNKSKVTWRRHLTVGSGAVVMWLHGARGNTWVKKGGHLGVLSWIGGDKQIFLRIDNPTSTWMVDHLYCQMEPAGSVEIIGPLSMDDSYHFAGGTTILAEGSSLTPQSRSTLNVAEKAGFVMLSGSRYNKQGNQNFGCDLIVHGNFSAGLPERPLASDCTLGLSWKAKRRFLDGKADTYRAERQDDVALLVMPEATFSIYSADPAKARLVMSWNGMEASAESSKGGDAAKENYLKLKEVKETFIEMYLLGKLNINGLHMDWINTGGIIVNDLSVTKEWKNVSFGTNNAVKEPVKLLKKWDGKTTYMFTTGDF